MHTVVFCKIENLGSKYLSFESVMHFIFPLLIYVCAAELLNSSTDVPLQQVSSDEQFRDGGINHTDVVGSSRLEENQTSVSGNNAKKSLKNDGFNRFYIIIHIE